MYSVIQIRLCPSSGDTETRQFVTYVSQLVFDLGEGYQQKIEENTLMRILVEAKQTAI